MSSHKPTNNGPIYGEFNFAKKDGKAYVRGYFRGGITDLAHKASALDNPRPSGITPTKINVKARMSPRYAKGGKV